MTPSSPAFLPLPPLPHRSTKPSRHPHPRHPPISQLPPPISLHRSKFILTRRVHIWTLPSPSPSPSPSPPSSSSSSPSHSPSSPEPFLPSLPVLPSANLSAPPALPRQLISALPPVRAFVFQRGLLTTVQKRRHADPPHRYLRLRYGLITPRAPGHIAASNPRASGPHALKAWYTTARRWSLLSHPTPATPKLRLRHRFPHSISPHLSSNTSVSAKPRSRLLGLAPRLIVVGDVHGCIDELQALLRLADYTPGDQIIMLGDLVAKGPDSPAVVQLCREIGARTVRGNHDYEVVRYWDAVRRGHDVPVSPEHSNIARAMNHDDLNFLMDAPWFIESTAHHHLFVHAGFIPGVKLTQQNPRLMMNMRSVLKDGTVSAKSVLGCEWAKFWQGPHTVVFGHDACRGLQQFQFAKGIDTGCVYGGRLTALLLPENRMISVAAKRCYVSPRKLRSFPRPLTHT